MGQRSELLSDVATVHGPYARESLRRLVAEIDPDLSALVSIWPETYSHTLTESWAFGLPVIATDIGAIAERIRRHGGGFLIPVDDPGQAAKMVLDLVEDPASVEYLRRAVPRSAVRSRAAMAEDYRALYDEVSFGRAPATQLHVGYVVHGALGSHPGSAHVRVMRRLALAAADGRLRARQVTGDQIVRHDLADQLDVVLVQRDALNHEAQEVVAALRHQGTRLVVELDDDLLHDDASARMRLESAEHDLRRANLTELVTHADAVITSTAVVAERLAEFAVDDPVVVPNELDARLWLREVPADPPPARDELRVLYMGSRTHLDDLLLLEDAFRGLSEQVGRKVVLEVAGIADRFDGDGWFKRLHVPGELRNYPEFVRWLRVHRQRWSAAVAPLVDADFNHAKSDLKLLEYALLGLPVVASDVGPYRAAGHLAVLTANDPISWREALVATLTDLHAAQQRVQASAAHVIETRLLSPVNLERWLRSLAGSGSS
jgi:glycosyltransferase involved in cell wall biosynthesis